MRHYGSAAASADDGSGAAFSGRLMRRLWRYVRPHRALVGASLVLVVAVAAVQLVQPWLIKIAIDEHITPGRLAGLGKIAVLYFAALVAQFGLRHLQIWVLELTGQNVVYELRTHVFSHAMRLDASYFDKHPVGRLMTRVTSDVEALNEAFTSGLVMIVADLMLLVGIVGVLFWVDWRLALVTMAALPVMGGLSLFFRSRLRVAYRTVRARVARLNAFLHESVAGMRVVQLFVRERATCEEFRQVNREHRDAELGAVTYDSAFSAVAELVGSLALAGIVWVGGLRVLSGSVTFGTLVMFIEYAGKFFQPVQQLSQRYAVMQAAMASAERLFELLDTRAEVQAPGSPRRLPNRTAGEIEFDRVEFAYVEGEPVLRGVSFRVAPGELVGVAGWTGAGKSTLIRLLARLYDVRAGRVLLDGIDVRELDPDELRHAIGFVPQEPFLFTGTIASNVSLDDPNVSRERVEHAVAAVGAAELFARHSGGLDTVVHERGSNLSTGERQLISLARAFAFDPPVLVLDEATASVDPETERRIHDAMERLMRGRTTLVIAHRLETIRGADKILLLHKGELAEEGTHEQLLTRETSLYRTLWSLQAS